MEPVFPLFALTFLFRVEGGGGISLMGLLRETGADGGGGISVLLLLLDAVVLDAVLATPLEGEEEGMTL